MVSETLNPERALKALADPTRLEIVELLSACCCGRASVDESGEVVGATASEVCCQVTGREKITSTVSHHLHELREAGIVRIDRSGKNMICSLQPEALKGLARFIDSLAEGKDYDCC